MRKGDSDTAPFLPHIRTTGLHLGSLPSTACFSNLTRPRPSAPPAAPLRLLSSQTFTCVHYPNSPIPVIRLLTPPMQTKYKDVPKCRHTKFRHQGITQKKHTTSLYLIKCRHLCGIINCIQWYEGSINQ
jgi:hypothetical protein